MAKYAHRVFEMYDFRDEAVRALMPKSVNPVTELPSESPSRLRFATEINELRNMERPSRSKQKG